MGAKMVPKMILEGTRLTHKTDLAFALNEHPRIVGARKYRYHSPVVSGEWCGFTNTPWGRGLINFLPEETDHAMATFDAWARMFELQRYYSWIVDRFHLSTRVFQKRERGRDFDFSWLEERLVALNFRLIHVRRDPDSFAAARTERLKVSGKPSQYDDLSVFVKEQEAFTAVVADSSLKTLTLDISDDDVDRAADQVADWMQETGGLFLD